MIHFRASSSGACLRMLTMRALHPEYGNEEKKHRELFLRMGHTIQDTALKYLSEHGLPDYETEEEWEWSTQGFHIVGHTDARFVHDGSLGEVKALKTANVAKLSRGGWNLEDNYAGYLDQVAVYGWLMSAQLSYACPETRFFIVDRDTSDIYGGHQMTCPQYTYVPELCIDQDALTARLAAVIVKMTVAREYIESEEIASCDKEGFCWDCSEWTAKDGIKTRGKAAVEGVASLEEMLEEL